MFVHVLLLVQLAVNMRSSSVRVAEVVTTHELLQDPDASLSDSESDCDGGPCSHTGLSGHVGTSARPQATSSLPPQAPAVPDPGPVPSEDVSWLSQPRQITENISQVRVAECTLSAVS